MSIAVITGSAGLIGSEAVRHFAHQGLDVVGIGPGTVLLDGSGSADPDNDPLTYPWALFHEPAGPSVVHEVGETRILNAVPSACDAVNNARAVS